MATTNPWGVPSEDFTSVMLALSGIPATSLWGLRARAEEHLRPDALFQDPVAAAWYRGWAPHVPPEVNRWYTPALQQGIALRTAILDQATQQWLEQHPEHGLIELGCGFSTRFFRLEMPVHPWYELDLAEILAMRRRWGEMPENLHLIESSVFDTQWMQTLASAHPPDKLMLVAEGLLMYFPLTQVRAFFADLQRYLPGARIAFDVMGGMNIEAAQDPAEDVHARIHWGLPHLKDAPRVFGIQPLADLTLAAQLRQHPAWAQRISRLQRLLISLPWLSARMGGTLYGKIPNPGV
jgi:O-methyltransferase involved in polyketide biosynthesis